MDEDIDVRDRLLSGMSGVLFLKTKKNILINKKRRKLLE